MKRYEKYIDTILDSETPICDICKERLGYDPCKINDLSNITCASQTKRNKQWLKESVTESKKKDRFVYRLSILELTLLKEWRSHGIEYISFWSDHITGLFCDNQIILLNCIEESKLFKIILNDTYEIHGNDFINIDEILDNYQLIKNDEDLVKAHNASGIKSEPLIKALNAMKSKFNGIQKDNLKDD